jgi:predicted acyltransferase
VPETRLLSLDAFRGLTMAAMVLVNNPGTWRAVYAPLQHADWNGLTPTDVIFPCFLFIVGVAIALSRPTPARVVRRAAIIFALGLVLNGLPSFDWTTLRIPGVLQRIAVCYLVAAVLFLTTRLRMQALVTAALLLGYWAAMTLVPVPGHGPGDLGPEGNLAAWLDRALLGRHVLRLTRVYDPEGILSTVPAVATTLLGVLTGQWVTCARARSAIAVGMVLAGAVACLVGVVWGLVFPVNKALWTSSYAVLTAGLALLVFAACYAAIEVRGWRRWATPFVVLGVNALLLFFLSTLAARVLMLIHVDGATLQRTIFDRAFAPWASPIDASLAYAVAYVLAWWVVMWLVYRAGIRLRA